jgi:hypothetical protein
MRARAREGSRPRDPLLTEPSTCHNRGTNTPSGLWQVLAARGDARPPWSLALPLLELLGYIQT